MIFFCFSEEYFIISFQIIRSPYLSFVGFLSSYPGGILFLYRVSPSLYILINSSSENFGNNFFSKISHSLDLHGCSFISDENFSLDDSNLFFIVLRDRCILIGRYYCPS